MNLVLQNCLLILKPFRLASLSVPVPYVVDMLFNGESENGEEELIGEPIIPTSTDE